MHDLLLLTVSLLLTIILSLWQSRYQVGIGSDHPVHQFLINAIRENRHRLFTQVPRILNKSYCGGLPLFLHWLLSFLSNSNVIRVAYILNPLCNSILIVSTFCFVKLTAPEGFPVGLICLILASTPQFYHISNARGAGISARPVGAVLFYLLTQLVITGELFFSLSAALIADVAVGYLIWGTSTFAIQAVILCGLIMGVFFQKWLLLAVFFISSMVFIIIHPAYGKSFVKHTLQFINKYRTDVAAIFILKYRYSIWRDLVYDIPKNIIRSPANGFAYAYNNSLLIVLILNPLTLMSVVIGFQYPINTAWLIDQWHFSVAGLIICLATSFRATRFLGEPERYVEIVTPYAITVCVGILYGLDKLGMLYVLFAFSMLLNTLQMILIWYEATNTKNRSLPECAQVISQVINDRCNGLGKVRFACNNENLTKFFLIQSWYFAKYWSTEERYGGYCFKDAYTKYPFVKREPFENVVREYNINYCLLDKSVFQDLFSETQKDQKHLTLLFEDARYQLYHIPYDL